jgi:5S rRNA maturation endonuclease (ribonuclease M5)
MEFQTGKEAFFARCEVKFPVGFSSFIENLVSKSKLDGSREKVIVLVDLDNFGKEIGEDKSSLNLVFSKIECYINYSLEKDGNACINVYSNISLSSKRDTSCTEYHEV